MSAPDVSKQPRVQTGDPSSKGGQWKTGARPSGDVDLDEPAPEIPTVMVGVTFQAPGQNWGEEDGYLGSAQFDIGPLIAETPPERRLTEFGDWDSSPETADYWLEEAMKRGLVETRPRPWRVYSSDLEDLVRDDALGDIPIKAEPKIFPGIPLEQPLTVEEIVAEADEDGFVTATVSIGLGELMDAREEYGRLGEVNEVDLLAGRLSPLPPHDFSYDVRGVAGDGSLLVEVSTNVRGAARDHLHANDKTENEDR